MDKASLALALSGLAIVVAIIIGIVTAIISVRGNRLQRRVTIIEEDRRAEEVEAQRRADLHARLEPPGRPDYLVLSATGGTDARDVVVEVEPATILADGTRMSFPSLEPGQQEHLRVFVTHDDFPADVPRIVVVRIRWRDDLGPRAKETRLSP
jgi:hypothetical protein